MGTSQNAFRVNRGTDYSTIILLAVTLALGWSVLYPILKIFTVIVEILIAFSFLFFYFRNKTTDILLDDQGVCVKSRISSRKINWSDIKSSAHKPIWNSRYGLLQLFTKTGSVFIPLDLDGREKFIKLYNSKSKCPIKLST